MHPYGFNQSLTIPSLQRGTLLALGLGLPLRPSQQTPHAQDEFYFINSGRGVLIRESNRDRFESGGHLFVAAGDYRGPVVINGFINIYPTFCQK